jgi:hypothetical protein
MGSKKNLFGTQLGVAMMITVHYTAAAALLFISDWSTESMIRD